MRTKDALIIFVKNPVLGKVKTRLAKDIGDEKALEVYKFLLSHTKDVTDDLGCSRYVFCSELIDENSLWSDPVYKKCLQQGADLGERMQNAIASVFEEGYNKVAIIGSDCASLSSGHIKEAFKKLDGNELVIGPAEDGGYYLLGMRNYYPFLFVNKSWSTPDLIDETLGEIKQKHLSFSLLPVLTDVDNLEDLKQIYGYRNIFLLH